MLIKPIQDYESGPKDVAHDYDLPPGLYRYERPIGWSNVDPAQIAFTGNIPAFGLEAMESWVQKTVGASWFELNMDYGIGTPFVHLELDFKSPVLGRFPLRMTVEIEKLGTSSLGVCVRGSQLGHFEQTEKPEPQAHAEDEERLCFVAHYVCVFVDAIKMTPLEIPPQIRRNLQTYQRQQDQ